MIKSVKQYTVSPDKNKFTKDELKLIDMEGLTRNYLTITVKEVNDEYMNAIRDITRLQYKLPIKYIKPIPNNYSYVCQKSYIQGDNKDIKNASITIEPLNNDFNNIISYTPLNQSMPLDTIITINVAIPFEETERKFIWSNNLSLHDDIKLEGIYTKPWLRCCHYGCLDIGSVLTGKFSVAYVDTDIVSSFSLFGFRRSDEHKEFTIWVYQCYNLTPIDILKMLLNHNSVSEDGKKFINEILVNIK